MKLLGYSFFESKNKPNVKSPIPEILQGSTLMSNHSFLDMNTSFASESEQITKYQTMAVHAEIDNAITEIVNEAVVANHKGVILTINLDGLTGYDDDYKESIRREFNIILQLLNFNNDAADWFRTWYVDGRLFVHMTSDRKNPKKGIQTIQWIDPRKIKKCVEHTYETDEHGFRMVNETLEYFSYCENGVASGEDFKLTKDSVAYVHSGLSDPNTGHIISYLHKAIRPLNQLRRTEDAIVVYRLSRAPERRLFKVEVGDLSKPKADEFLKKQIAEYRNSQAYDPNTGDVRDDKRFFAMGEDFWFAMRNGVGTTVDTLQGGSNLGELADVQYFQKLLSATLNVPISRLTTDNPFGGLGRATEITREEYKFGRFIQKLRKNFNGLFNQMLRCQLLLKGLVDPEDWEEIQYQIQYVYHQDTHFSELAELEIARERTSLARDSKDLVEDGYFSKDYVRRRFLNFDDETIKKEDEIIRKEKSSGENAGEGGPAPGFEPIVEPDPSAPDLPQDFDAGPNDEPEESGQE